MPIYDLHCKACERLRLDAYVPSASSPNPVCESCGADTERVFTARSTNIIPDEIPGGVEIRHGLCNEDGSPRRFYSKSEIARVAREKGYTNYVEHSPLPGTDKSKHTSRWV